MLELVASGEIPPPHISHTFPFEEDTLTDAFTVMLERKLVGKVVIDMDRSAG